MKKIFISAFLLIISAFFVQIEAFSLDDEALLKSDYKTAYINYNNNLKNEKTAQNYLNMCKVIYMLKDDYNAKLYCKEALNYIEREKNPDLELKSGIFQMLGNIYAAAYHNNDITFEYLNKAKALRESNSDTDKYELAKLYKTIAYMYNYTKNSLLADEYYTKALDIVTNRPEKKYAVIEAAIYNDLALIERRKQNYEKSKEYLDIGIEKAEGSGDYVNYSLLAALYENTARYYEHNKKDKASAVTYYKKAAESNRKFPDKKDREFSESDINKTNEYDSILSENEIYPYDININLILGFYNAKNDEKVSEEYFNKAINVNPQNPFVYADIAYIYAILYVNNNKVNTEYLNKSKEYIKTAETNGKYSPDIYYSLANTSMKLNLTKNAAKYFKKYMEYSENKLEAVNKVQTYFDSEKNYFPKDIKNDILK